METTTKYSPTEGEIWGRIVAPQTGGLNQASARSLLELDFNSADRRRMDVLAEKAGAGFLTERERREADVYNRVAHLLALLQSKARQSLRTRKKR